MSLSLYHPFSSGYGHTGDGDDEPPPAGGGGTTGGGGTSDEPGGGTSPLSTKPDYLSDLDRGGGGGEGVSGGVEDWYNIFQSLGGPRQAPALPKGPQWDMGKDPIWLQLNEAISSALKGGTTFDRDTIERMKGAARIRSENLRDQGTARVRANVISRGLQDSPLGQSLEAEADRAADADYQSTSTQIEVQATVQNYKDRMGALDRAERLLNSKMSYVLALANNEIQRAEIALAYRRIDEARSALDKQLSAQLYGMQAGFEFQKEFFNLQLPVILAQLQQE